MSTKEEKLKALKKLAKKYSKEEGGGYVGFGLPNVSKLPTPFPQVNVLTGGIPKGRITCLTGAPGTCKSTICLQMIAHWHSIDEDSIIGIVDAENTMEETWAARLGVDTERVYLIQKQESLEDNLDKTIELITTGAVDAIFYDSIGAVSPEGELKDKGGELRSIRDDQVGLDARKMSKFFRKAVPLVSRANIPLVLVAQVYQSPTTYGMPIWEIRGGTAFKHHTSIRLKTRRSKSDKQVDVQMPDGTKKKLATGFNMHVKLDKTKLNERESQEITIPFRYGAGLMGEEANIITAIHFGIIIRKGGWFYPLPDNPEVKIQGRNALLDWYTSEENKGHLKDLMERLETVAEEDQVKTVQETESSSEDTSELDVDEFTNLLEGI